MVDAGPEVLSPLILRDPSTSLLAGTGRGDHPSPDEDRTSDCSIGPPPLAHEPVMNGRNLMCMGVTIVLFFFAFLSSLILQTLANVLLLPLFMVSPKAKIITGGLIMRFCQASAVFLNPFWTTKVVRPCLDGWKPSRTIIMCNHLSSLDPWIITRNLVPWELKWVYKKDLEKIPVFGLSVKMCNDLAIEFTKEGGGWKTKPGSVQRMMEKVKSYLEMGIGIVVFPEGTRSKSGRLQRFKPGFLRCAIEQKVEIMPTVLWNTNSIWALGSYVICPGTMYFSWGTPIMPSEDDTVESLEMKVKAQMMELLNEMPGFDPATMKPLQEFTTTRGDHGKRGWA
eukprot:GHVH01006731.1.p1 GENE.GHVH01006731.1~~GHVH01006731.1.p1  ORF type:complete len:338 (+),score=32.63 GHVH01006731.1:81-1094(+)